MGEVELLEQRIIIRSHIITYGTAASEELTDRIRGEIEEMWNEPKATVVIKGVPHPVQFNITAALAPQLQPIDVISNTDPRNNYFRIEPSAIGNISFVDGIGCNTGYFLEENLYEGSTTAAHEYGHSIGLNHPRMLDLRGQGIPGIMYPRGTLVDASYQYNSMAVAGDNRNGGTMHPRFRKVKQKDIDYLKIPLLHWQRGKAIIGAFSSVWHESHG